MRMFAYSSTAPTCPGRMTVVESCSVTIAGPGTTWPGSRDPSPVVVALQTGLARIAWAGIVSLSR